MGWVCDVLVNLMLEMVMIDASRLEILVVGNEFDSFYELARFLGCKYTCYC